MLLERIDIDRQGPLHRVQLGPFSHKLNAIYGPAGSGKTAIQNFMRNMMGDHRHRSAMAGMHLGRIVWAGREGLLHCNREFEGQLTLHFESRDGRPADRRYALDPMLSHLSPAVIDGIVTSSDDYSVAHAWAAAQRAGLETAGQVEYPDQAEIVRLQNRATELDRALSANSSAAGSKQTLEHRLAVLSTEWARHEHSPAVTDEFHSATAQRRSLAQREEDVAEDIRRLHEQEAELRRMLADIDTELQAVTHFCGAEHSRYAIAETHRRQLEDLDSQLIRWRRTLRDIRQLRDRLENSSSRDSSPLQAALYNGDPLRCEWSPGAGSLYSLESRLEATQREIEWLSSRYDLDSLSDQPPPLHGPAEATVPSLGSRLQQLKIRLHRVTTRLFLYPHSDVRTSFDEFRSELMACENELLGAIDHLIRHRNEMLKRIAAQHDVPLDQMVTAFGDWRQCQDHPHLYDWLLSEGCPPRIDDRRAHASRLTRLESDRAECSHELDRTVNRLENSIVELRRVRAQQAGIPVVDLYAHARRGAQIKRELDEVQQQLERLRVHEQQLEERDQCLLRIAGLRRSRVQPSSLALRASTWLQRLSGGRLQRLQASTAAAVCIDGHPEDQRSPLDRFLAVLAIRMAAVDELTRRGHGVPLLIETPTALDANRPVNDASAGYDLRHGYGLRQGYPYTGYRFDPSGPAWLDDSSFTHEVVSGLPHWLDTVMAFADAGHQTILLTRQMQIADCVAAVGGTVHRLAATDHATPRQVVAYRSPVSYRTPSYREGTRLQDVNRDLDTAWREAYGVYDHPDGYLSGRPRRASHDEPPKYTRSIKSTTNAQHTSSPFFLTADSLVDQAPSVDAVAGARLRGVGVLRIGQLLVADPSRLADALGMDNVDEAAVLRWQNEARLVCRVPQLRAFDARVLVGCGITEPKQLAAMHPGELLERVELFLATDRGRQILRSGSSHELSRITSWIAAANRSVSREDRHGSRTAAHADRHSPRANDIPATDQGTAVSNRQHSDGYDADGYDRSGYDRSGYDREGFNRNGFRRGQSVVEPQPRQREGRSRRHERSGRSERKQRAREAQSRGQRAAREIQHAEPTRAQADRDVVSMHSTTAGPSAPASGWQFYLECKSPIVDAPTIGPRTANKLEKLGLYTVEDLLNSDPSEVASQLGNRRIDAEEVRAWQRQASLVCRIPMLRGHDAQLLVAAGICDPEQLAQSNPQRLLRQVSEVADSQDGIRILRGATAPDLSEVTKWIEFAAHHRELRAA